MEAENRASIFTSMSEMPLDLEAPSSGAIRRIFMVFVTARKV